MNCKNLVLLIVLVVLVPSFKTKNELKNLCRQERQILFTKMSLIRLVSNVIWVVLNQKNLGKKTQPDKDLRDKVFKIAVAQKYDGYQRGLASIVYRFFDKNSI